MQATTKLTGTDRYAVYLTSDDHGTPITDATGAPLYHLWDHEDAEMVSDRDGRTLFPLRDARDLAAEYIG